MNDEDYHQQRMREIAPFPDGHGLRGPIVTPQVRQIEGAVGGNQSYGVVDQNNLRDPVDNGGVVNTGNIPKVIIATNGTAYYYTLSGTRGAAVT